MVRWYTRHLDATQATTTYSLFTLNTVNATVASPTVPSGYGHVKYMKVAVVPDTTAVVDVGNIFVVKLSGDAMVHGDQELIVGAITSQETGTSVTETVYQKNAFFLNTNIWVDQNESIDISGAYFGTDIGSPVFSVSLALERGRGGVPLQYRTRGDSVTQATDAFVSLETKADGSTGAFDIPRRSVFLPRMLTTATLNADGGATVGGNNYIFNLQGDAVGQTPQEIVTTSLGVEVGAGSITSTTILVHNPDVTPVEIPIVGGNSLDLQAGYKGLDLGTQFVAATLELAG